MRFISKWRLPAKRKYGLDNFKGTIMKSKYVKFKVKIILCCDRDLLISYDQTINELIDKNCIRIESVKTDDGIIYGIKVYKIEYEWLVFEKETSYIISFSEQFNGDVNLLHGSKNYIPYNPDD